MQELQVRDRLAQILVVCSSCLESKSGRWRKKYISLYAHAWAVRTDMMNVIKIAVYIANLSREPKHIGSGYTCSAFRIRTEMSKYMEERPENEEVGDSESLSGSDRREQERCVLGER